MSARKSKRKQKSRRSRRQAAERALSRRVRRSFPRQKVNIGPPRDGIKMSEVLAQFIQPYSECAETEEAYRMLLAVAVVAWNVTLFPEKDREARLEELLGTFPEETRDAGRGIIEELMDRKVKLFSHYRRMIIDFEVADTGERLHLSVLSAATPV